MNYKKIIFPFRSDEEYLKNKWWHRLLVVLFFITLVFTPIFTWWGYNDNERSDFSYCISRGGVGFNNDGIDFRPTNFDTIDYCEMKYPIHSLLNLSIAILLTIILSYFFQFIYYKILLYIIYGNHLS